MIHLVFYASQPDDLSNVENYVEDAMIDLNCISRTCDYPMDVLDYINENRPERVSVFFDTVNLEDGLEIARKVHEINPKYRFNLLCEDTCDAEIMYSKGVTYFVNKPYHHPGISKCITNVIDFFSEAQSRTITLKKKNGDDALRFSEIKYIMSDKRKVIFCCENRESEYYYKLDEIENLLDVAFVRCHQSYIVNMKRIKLFVDEGVILYDDTFIPVSRNKYYATKRRYLAFVSGKEISEM